MGAAWVQAETHRSRVRVSVPHDGDGVADHLVEVDRDDVGDQAVGADGLSPSGG
jgi:hypothetical protein